MHRPSLTGFLSAMLIVWFVGLGSSALGQDLECRQLANDLLTNGGAKQEFLLENNFAVVTNSVVCLAEGNFEALAPQRTALWNAFNSFSGSEEQGASSSAGASTNVVSKPAGPSALVEEFGGANVSSGTSSMTVQWAPGTMLANMALTGVDFLCLGPGQPRGCLAPKLLKDLTPLTLKVTANTSSGSSSVAGTASGTSTGGSSQSVTVSSKGASKPGFAGMTAQYSFWGSKKQAGVKALTNSSTPTAYANEMAAALALTNALNSDTCKDTYTSWQATSKAAVRATLAGSPNPTSAQIQATQNVLEAQYRLFVMQMQSAKGCAPAFQAIRKLIAAVLEAEDYEEFVAMQNSGTPELALEYDLNTPQSQPSYSTVKFTANWQFGKTASKANAAIQNYAQGQQAAIDAAVTRSANSTKTVSGTAKSLAEATAQPWSLTITGGADLYHSEPSSSIPSGSHLRDIQAGAEISYLFTPSSSSGPLRTLIGPVTGALAYSYQDQTSPAILTGPVLSDFTGLPSSTTSAYTKRGPINLGQLRFGFGTGSNLTFPIAFTYSNRTELVVHPTWGIQFGVSYSLASLFASSGASQSGGSSSAK